MPVRIEDGPDAVALDDVEGRIEYDDVSFAYTDGEGYPEIPEDERLFDRERVAAIVTGDARA